MNPTVRALGVKLAKMAVAQRAELKVRLRLRAERLAKAQRELVRKKTGKLASTIRVEEGDHDLHLYVRAGGADTTSQPTSGRPPYDYALGQEFGNSKTPASPFFYPPYRKEKKSIRWAIDQGVSRIIRMFW